jgi:hypothetical protein
MRTNVPGKGWVPNPMGEHTSETTYPGLTCQVWHVSRLVRRQLPNLWMGWHESIIRNSTTLLLDQLEAWLLNCDVTGRHGNTQVHVQDTLLLDCQAYLEAMSFYWWPWTLLILDELIAGARGVDIVLEERANWAFGEAAASGSTKDVQKWETSLIGECLYCLGVIRERRRK